LGGGQAGDQDRVKQLVNDARIGMLTTMTADGRHVSRPMALQDVEFDGDLWFFAYEDSDLAQQIAAYPQVNVAFSDSTQQSWVSIAGAAVIVHDDAKAKDLWNPINQAWFPDGLETPGLALIKVHAETAEYWASAHTSRVVTRLAYARAAVTGNTPPAGENETVRL